MRMILISEDADTLVGFRMAGVPGHMVRTPEELAEALEPILQDATVGIPQDERVGILLLTEGIAGRYGAEIRGQLRDRELPLVVTIP